MRDRRRQRAGKFRWGSMLLTAAVACVVLVGVVWLFGGVSGEEFSPQKFTMRRFQYWQIPILKIQVWPVSLNKIGGNEDKLAKHIRMNRLHGSVSSQQNTWDLVSLDEISGKTFRGDASILTNYLKQPGAVGLTSLLDWTIDHPALAKEVWPLVALLAHEGLYPVIPEVLDAIHRHDDETLGNAVRSLAVKECLAIAKAEQQSGDAKRAANTLRVIAQIETGIWTHTDEDSSESFENAEADPEVFVD